VYRGQLYVLGTAMYIGDSYEYWGRMKCKVFNNLKDL
jgi:hypothetical protein